MSFWAKLFGLDGAKQPKVQIDWLEIEARVRQIDELERQNNQLASKQALLDADKLVDSLLKQLTGGNTFAERLKSLRNRFPRDLYDKLWKAHIKRNELVHETGSFAADWEVKTHLRNYRETVTFLRSLSLK